MINNNFEIFEIKDNLFLTKHYTVDLSRTVGFSEKKQDEMDDAKGILNGAFVYFYFFLDTGNLLRINFDFWNYHRQGPEQTKRIDENYQNIVNMLTEYYKANGKS